MISEKDLFWPQKAKLFVDEKKLEQIDRSVKHVSAVGNNPENLVKILTRDCKTEAESFRAIFRWIAENISYDVAGLRNETDSPEQPLDVLRTRKAVCIGYAKLLKYLCESAKIECIVVTGISKGENYYPGKPFEIDKHGEPVLNYLKKEYGHAWNIVKLNGESFVCDVTWASGSADGFEFKKLWKEVWFLTNPLAFVETHWPMSDKKSAPEMQTLKNPIKKFSDWNDRARRGGDSYDFKVSLISHIHGIIRTKESEIAIKIGYKFPLHVQAVLESVVYKEDYSKYVLTSQSKNEYTVHVRLPAMQGKKFKLKINGKPSMCNFEPSISSLVQYTVIGEGQLRAQPFPSKLQYLGFSQEESVRGYCVKNGKSPIFKSRSGKTILKFTTPEEDRLINFHATVKLLSCDAEMVNVHYVEVVKDRLLVYTNLPHQGQYLVTLFRAKSVNSDVLTSIGYFMFHCDRGTTDIRTLPKQRTMFGPTTELQRIKAKIVGQIGGVIKANKGQANLVIETPEFGIDMAWGLYIGDHQFDKSRCICAETDSQVVKFRFRLPEAGFYHFVANQIIHGQPGKILLSYLIDCKEAFKGDLFPSMWTRWGPQKDFKRLGFQILNHKCSTIQTKSGQVEVRLKNPRNTRTMHDLLNSDGKQLPVERHVSKSIADDTVSYKVTLTESGEYALRLSTVKIDNSWQDWLMIYLITCKKPGKL